MQVKISDNKIRVSSHRWAFIIFILCGIISLTVGIVMFGRLVTIDHVLIGVGIVFASSGSLFLLNARNYVIEVEPDKGILRIIDAGKKRRLPVEIPISFFKYIIIERSLNEHASGKRQTTGYEISLMSDSGSSLHVASFNDRDKTIQQGKELQKIFNVDLISEEDSIKKLLTKRLVGINSIDASLPEKSAVVSNTEGDSIAVTWNCRKSLIQQFLIAIIIYGFFHLVHFAVVPTSVNPAVSVLAYGIIILMILIVVSIIVVSAIGTYHLLISNVTIQYHVSLFGKKTGERSMEKSNIGMIKHSIGGQDNTISIMSTKGLKIISELMDTFKQPASSGPDLSMAGAVFSLKDEIMSINVSSLSMREKWYIVSRILHG